MTQPFSLIRRPTRTERFDIDVQVEVTSPSIERIHAQTVQAIVAGCCAAQVAALEALRQTVKDVTD